MAYEDVNRRAGIPFHYPLVFFVNIVLIIALELLLVYRQPLPLTQELLARELPVYEDAAILRETDRNLIEWYLVQTGEGEYHVVPVRRHAVFFDRGKICDDQIVTVPPDTGEMEITTRDGVVAFTVLAGREVSPAVGEEITGEMEIRPKWYGHSNASAFTYGFYFLAGLAMSLAEAFLWHKIKG